MIKLWLLNPIRNIHPPDLIIIRSVKVIILRIEPIFLVILRIDKQMEEKACSRSDANGHQHDVPELRRVIRTHHPVAFEAQEDPGDDVDGDVGNDGHGVPDGRQFGALAHQRGQIGNHRQMGYL